jgi:inner membrane protein
MSDDHTFSRIINSQFTRIFIVTFLILLLQIPIVFLQSLINDRQNNLSFAETSITESWGQPQTLVGPQMNIPYIIETGSGEEIKQIRKLATFLPETLEIRGNLATEIRYRGLFEIPVYQAELTLLGEFQRPDFTTWTATEENILWDEAELTLEIADTRAIQSQTELLWNSEPLSFEPGLGKLGGDTPGIHVPLRGQMEGEQFTFQMPLRLKGSQKITFAPFGKLTQVELTSDWLDPSFQGPWLPTTRSVDDEGFQAAWESPYLGRSYPQQWNDDKALSYDLLQGSLFGDD